MIVACEKQEDTFTKKKGIFTKINIINVKRNKSCENLNHKKLQERKRKSTKKKTVKIPIENKENEKKEEENKKEKNEKKKIESINNNINNISNKNNINKEIKSNLSSSMGKNFILKSDFCKSTVSNKYKNNLRREESNPMLSYYGIDKPPKNVVNDYLLFVKKLKGEIDDFQELFDKGENYINKTKKEIIISTYVDDEETIKYIDVNEDNDDYDSKNEFNQDDIIRNNLFQNNLINLNSNINYNNNNQNNDYFSNNNYFQQNNFGSNYQNNYININNNYSMFNNNNNNNNNINNNNINNNNININNINNININNINNNNNHNNTTISNNRNPLLNYSNYINNNNLQNNYQYSQLRQNQTNSYYPRNNYSNNIIFNNNNKSEISHLNFQNENYSNYTDSSLAKISPYLIKEQSGCRFIQEKIQSNPSFANDLLFPELKNSLSELICDQFGNYLFQVLLDVLSFENLSEFLTLTQQSFFQICTSCHGTRVIQKLVDKVSSSPILLNKFIYNICSDNLKEIMKTPYGNHIIQKYLTTIHNCEYTNFIFQIVIENFLDITNSKHGVCVIQKCISEGDESQRPKILNLILKNLDKIINDQFGNYVIQYLLITNDLDFNEIKDIIHKISLNIIDYCKKKFSANVIEKCFENSKENTRNILLNSMIEKDPHSIIDLLMDPFGNYVIQKALIVEKGILYTRILQIITKGISEIKKS